MNEAQKIAQELRAKRAAKETADKAETLIEDAAKAAVEKDIPRRWEALINIHDGLGNKYLSGEIVTETPENAEAVRVWIERGQVKPA